MSEYTTKSTNLGNGLYGCRVFKSDRLICEMRVRKIHISWAFYYMLRTIDKMGGDEMTDRSRFRFTEKYDNALKEGFTLLEGMRTPSYKTQILWYNLSEVCF